MNRSFHFAGSVTYIENYYESHEHQHKDSDDSSEMKNDTDEVVFEQSVVAFFQRWSNQGYVNAGVPNGSSITRFLHDDCHLELGVTQKSYGNYIRKKINDGNIDYEVEGFVEDFAKSHNI